MSAGTGVYHSEYNPSPTDPTHLLQIWIVPDKKGLTPRYDQKSFTDRPAGKWAVVATNDGRDGSIAIRQDVTLLAARLRLGDSVDHQFAAGRGGWLHVATGAATVNGLNLSSGDAAKIEGESQIEVTGVAEGQVILFDLA